MSTDTTHQPTALDAIMEAALQALLAAPALAGGRVLGEDEADELPQEAEAQIVVSWESSNPQPHTTATTLWQTVLRIDAQRRHNAATRHTGTGARVNPAVGLLAQAQARLMADPTLGGLAMHTEPGPIRRDADALDTRIGAAYTLLRVDHLTPYGSLLAA